MSDRITPEERQAAYNRQWGIGPEVAAERRARVEAAQERIASGTAKADSETLRLLGLSADGLTDEQWDKAGKAGVSVHDSVTRISSPMDVNAGDEHAMAARLVVEPYVTRQAMKENGPSHPEYKRSAAHRALHTARLAVTDTTQLL